MSRFALCILIHFLTINALANTQFWIENQKELVIATRDGNTLKLRISNAPAASKISPDQSLTYLIRFKGSNLEIYENSTGSLQRSTPIGGVVRQIETNKDGSLLYLLDKASKSIRIFDAITLSQISEIPLSNEPVCFIYNASRDEFYVGFNNATVLTIKNGREHLAAKDLYRVPVAIHFSNKWRKVLVRTETFIAAYNIDDLSFQGFLQFEGRPGRIEIDAQENFAFIQYTDRNKIEKFNLSNLRSEDSFYTTQRKFQGKEIDPSTFHLKQESLQFYDPESGSLFLFEEAAPEATPPTPVDLPPGVSAGNNIHVNQEDEGPQNTPSIEVDSSANMVFTWTDSNGLDGSGEGVFGREFNSDGTPAGNDFQVNKTSANPQNSSNVAVRNNGDFMAVWTEESDRDGQGWGAFGRRFAAGAIELDLIDVIIPSNPIGKQIYPVIAYGNDMYIVAFAGPTDGDGRGVWMRRFNAATGVPLDPTDVPVNTSTAGDPWALDIAANPNGEFVIVWRDDSAGMDRVRARPFNPDGTPKTPTDFRCGPYNTGAKRNFSPDVGIANDGSFIVVWLEVGAGGIVGERFDSNAQSIEKFIATSEETGDKQDAPSIDSGPSGSFFVAWKDAKYGLFEIMGRYFDSQGDPVGSDFRVPATPPVNDDFQPNVVITPQDNFIATWYGRGRNPNIMARIFTVEGGTPSLSINDVSLFEGDSGTLQAVFTVSLSSTISSEVTVQYDTADGSATTADNDYDQESGVLTIPADTPSGTISITINGDPDIEPDENFFVNLSNPSNATISDAQGMGTIQDDDTPVIPVVSIGDISINEGSSGIATAQFTITISDPIDEQITLDFDTDDGTAQSPFDYLDNDIQVTIPINTTSFNVDVTIVDDLLQEGNETFTATLSNISANAVLGDAVAVATILDDECMFCDNFDDGILPAWDYKSPASFTESAGFLIGSPSGSGKIEAIATPVFPGCSNCSIRAGLKSASTTKGFVTLLGWYQDKKNKIEVQMKEGRDKWVLRQKVNGTVVEKKSFSQTIDPDTLYDVEILYDGSTFRLLVEGVEILSINATGSPNGTVGVSIKNVVGSIDHITVLP